MPELVFPRMRPKPPRERVTAPAPVTATGCGGMTAAFAAASERRSNARMCASGTDGGTGLKPSDRWVISLCEFHHREQHRIGEREIERKYEINLRALAAEFARRSPFWKRLSVM